MILLQFIIEYFVSGMIFIAVSLFFIFFIRKETKSKLFSDLEFETSNKSGETPHKLTLSMFSRPMKITEEEISISKERKICLVCKRKVGGFNLFICTDCDALYCGKCAETLSNKENSCWVCNTPFDKSKPSHPFKFVETKEEIAVEFEKSKKESEPKKK
jgi:hypothetical protein